MTDSAALLAPIEWRLRSLLPAPLYASTWIQPSSEHLTQVFHHLRTLQYILSDYVPRSVARNPPIPGQTRSHWQEGTLLFTDLAGFTALMEAHAIAGRDGAERLLTILNHYFSTMLEIVSKSRGDLRRFQRPKRRSPFDIGLELPWIRSLRRRWENPEDDESSIF